MGFIQAFRGAIGGTFADQWKDFFAPDDNITPTTAIFKGVQKGRNNNRGANYKGSENIITNGSKVVVPEGTALITLQDGKVTNLILEAGGYIYSSNDPNSKSIFGGDGFADSLIKQSWDRFKFGGSPAAEQTLFYVNLKEIPGNRFGTQSEIFFDDAYFNTQVGVITRGVYSLKIVDPILFVKNYLPQMFLLPGAKPFDFQDMDNQAVDQLFSEVVGSLSAAFSVYVNDADKGNRMSKIQSDQIGFAKALSKAVDENYGWKVDRGLEIVKTAILAIEYDEDTKKLMSDVKKADALSGNRGSSFFQQAAARGIQSAGENGGGSNMAFMGLGVNSAMGMANSMPQTNNNNSYQPNFNQGNTPVENTQSNNVVEDSTERLLKMKKLLDAEVITQEEFNKIKAELLGL